MKYNKEMYAGYPEQLEHAEAVIEWQEKEIERLKIENHIHTLEWLTVPENFQLMEVEHPETIEKLRQVFCKEQP